MSQTELDVKTQSWLMKRVFVIPNSGVARTALCLKRVIKATLVVVCLLLIVWSVHRCRLVQRPPVGDDKNVFVVAQLVGVVFCGEASLQRVVTLLSLGVGAACANLQVLVDPTCLRAKNLINSQACPKLKILSFFN